MQEEMEPSMWWFLRRQKEAGHRISVVCVWGALFYFNRCNAESVGIHLVWAGCSFLCKVKEAIC